MALTRVTCPECDAGLKSPTGFEVGQVITCPKCKNEFEVEEPQDETPKRPIKATSGKKPVKASSRDDDDEEDEDEEDERPKKKKKKKKRRDDDDDEDAKSNVAFYIRLGVLLVVMIGLGIMLILRLQNEKIF